MKNNLIEEDIIRIKKLINNVLKERFELIKDENIISEAPIIPTLLNKFLGTGVVSKLETSMGDDVIKNLEALFVKSQSNFTKNSLGKIIVKSASGTEVEMRTISAALDAVAKGKMTVDDVVKLLPKKLKDGTEFRSIFDTQLRNAKPKPKLKPNTNTNTNTNTTSGSSTTSNSGTQPFGPRKNTSSLSNPKEILKDPVLIEKNLSDLRKGYPKFNLFESQVDLVPGFSTNARNYVKLNYLESTETVIAQLKDARIELFSAKFGLLASTVGKLLRNPVNTAKWTIGALFALYLIKTGYGIYSIADKKTDSGLNWLDKNIPGGETNNTEPEKNNDVDWSKYKPQN
jgi:hypothetical protein